MPYKPRIAQLKITTLSKKGMGRALWNSSDGNSHEVDVPFSFPGDEALVRLLSRKGGVYQSEVLEREKSAEARVQPRCRHFEHCGGCSWQHISYQDQLKYKEEWIYGSLQPYLHPGVSRHAIIGCEPPWEYRNKMELSFSSDKGGHRYLGLILFRTRGHVFQMKECYLARPWIVETVEAVSHWWGESGLDAYHNGKDTGSLRTLTLREGQRTGDRMVILTVSGNPNDALTNSHLREFVSVVRKAVEPSQSDQKLSIFLRIQQISKGKPTQFFEMLLYGPDHIREVLHIETSRGNIDPIEFRISPTAFFQPNTRQAEKLYSRAIQLADISEGATIYDLYCGTGTLGICMAKKVKKVIGIELSPESALDAKENVKLNQLSNVSIHTGDVGHLLATLLKESPKPDLVLVDPPRIGLDPKALQHLLDIKAPQLIYISCNPATQVANLEVLLRGGYQIKAVQPVDQFPQTVHVENIVVLTG